MTFSINVPAATETRPITLTGDHKAVFTAPVTSEDSRFVELTVEGDTSAEGDIPGTSGWGYGSGGGNKNIDIDKCDSDPSNDDLTISYHGSPSGGSGYNFVTTITGTITSCGEGEGEGGSESTFTLLITDEDTVHISPNPANVAISSEEQDHWVELKAVKYAHGATENSETEVTVDWSHVDNVEFSDSEGGAIMTESQVNAYEAIVIWAKSSVAEAYTVKATSGSEGQDVEGILNAIGVELKDGTTVVDEDDIVYISDTPAMPNLKAKLVPSGLAGNVEWELEIEFERPNRNDEDVLSKTMAANAEWTLTQDFENHFYGGKAILTATHEGVDFERIFHIRGENPSENAVELEIGNNPFYAKAIARHESGTQQNRTYLQFNELGSLGPDYLNNIQYTPNRSSDQIGWGIYQLTNPAPSRDQVWSWTANVTSGIALMNSNLAEAPSYFAAVQRKYPNKYEAPPTTYTPPGTTTALSYIQAAAIQMFNGSSVVELLPNPTPPGGNSHFRSCWRFHPGNPSGERWEFVPNRNDYVEKIIQEHENP